MSAPRSMTAFGRGAAGDNERCWVVELRSVNHRFCDIKLKMPRELAAIEDAIKKEISAVIARGHVDVLITPGPGSGGATAYEVNIDQAREYYHALLEIAHALRLPGGPDLSQVAAEKGIIEPRERPTDTNTLWPLLQTALRQALAEADAMRREEGRALKDELLTRLDGFAATVEKIAAAVPEMLAKRERALRERLRALLGDTELDPARLAQEVAIIADKSDITEEIVRLRSHIGQFRNFMEMAEPVGRRIDFLLQEFLREINTMASKISNADATHLTVELKNEVEKMREQAANIE